MLIKRSATISAVEGKKVVLEFEDGQRFHIPKDEWLPGSPPAPGTPYVIQVLSADEAELSQDELARTLLNQILDQGEG